MRGKYNQLWKQFFSLDLGSFIFLTPAIQEAHQTGKGMADANVHLGPEVGCPTYRFKQDRKQWSCLVSNGIYGQPTEAFDLAQ